MGGLALAGFSVSPAGSALEGIVVGTVAPGLSVVAAAAVDGLLQDEVPVRVMDPGPGRAVASGDPADPDHVAEPASAQGGGQHVGIAGAH